MAAERAEITPEGRVRIYALNGEFDQTDSIDFGRGGATGFIDPVADWLAQAYLNYPIVNVGLNGLEGVAVIPQPGSSVFANTLQAAPATVPIPPSFLLYSIGLIGLVGLKRRFG